MLQKTKAIYVLILALCLIAGYFAYSYFTTPAQDVPQPQIKTYQWETQVDKAQGISFQYPKELLTTYIHPVAWPPTVTVTSGAFTCTETGSDIPPLGQTQKVTVGSLMYCVTKQNQGAAGSIYTNYTYTIPSGGKLVTLTFSLQAVQCVNYSDPQKTECENERSAFSANAFVNQIIPTITLSATTTSVVPVPQKKSGISGKVLLGPTCPVMRDPPDPQCADKLYTTDLILTTKDGLRIIKKFSSDDNGMFRVDAVAGEYQIKSNSQNMLPRCSSNGTISVIANTYTDTTVYCDTGIR